MTWRSPSTTALALGHQVPAALLLAQALSRTPCNLGGRAQIGSSPAEWRVIARLSPHLSSLVNTGFRRALTARLQGSVCRGQGASPA